MTTKTESSAPSPYTPIVSKFHPNLCCTFRVMLLTDRQTNKRNQKHNGKGMSVFNFTMLTCGEVVGLKDWVIQRIPALEFHPSNTGAPHWANMNLQNPRMKNKISCVTPGQFSSSYDQEESFHAVDHNLSPLHITILT